MDEKIPTAFIASLPSRWIIGAVAAMLLGVGELFAQSAPPLELEAKVPLGEVRGRIDHMAVDVRRQRVFVAELGNNSLGIVDLAQHKVAHRLEGLAEPQGVGYVASADMLYVANAGDGSVRQFGGETFAPAGRMDLGTDADNIRVDLGHNRVLVGYGGGALAVIDPAGGRKIGDIALKAHPEGFQLDPRGGRAFVNLPEMRSIAVVDLAAGRQTALWSTGKFGGNFPMAIDPDGGRIFVVFRSPPKLAAFSAGDGELAGSVESCGDADDVFLDAKRQRVYVSCGEGFVDVFGMAGGYPRIERIPTLPGARTALFVPELDRLFVAARARAGESAALWVFRPMP